MAQGQYQNITMYSVPSVGVQPPSPGPRKRRWLIPLVVVALLGAGGIAAWQVTKNKSTTGSDGSYTHIHLLLNPLDASVAALPCNRVRCDSCTAYFIAPRTCLEQYFNCVYSAKKKLSYCMLGYTCAIKSSNQVASQC